MNPGGWLMTADKTFIMETIDPEPCLERHQLNFSLQKSNETILFEELLNPPFDPLGNIQSLEIPPVRASRCPSSDSTYRTLLTLRQKA